MRQTLLVFYCICLFFSLLFHDVWSGLAWDSFIPSTGLFWLVVFCCVESVSRVVPWTSVHSVEWRRTRTLPASIGLVIDPPTFPSVSSITPLAGFTLWHSNIERICINEYCPTSKLGFLQKLNICSVFGEGLCGK